MTLWHVKLLEEQLLHICGGFSLHWRRVIRPKMFQTVVFKNVISIMKRTVKIRSVHNLKFLSALCIFWRNLSTCWFLRSESPKAIQLYAVQQHWGLLIHKLSCICEWTTCSCFAVGSTGVGMVFFAVQLTCRVSGSSLLSVDTLCWYTFCGCSAPLKQFSTEWYMSALPVLHPDQKAPH